MPPLSDEQLHALEVAYHEEEDANRDLRMEGLEGDNEHLRHEVDALHQRGEYEGDDAEAYDDSDSDEDWELNKAREVITTQQKQLDRQKIQSDEAKAELAAQEGVIAKQKSALDAQKHRLSACVEEIARLQAVLDAHTTREQEHASAAAQPSTHGPALALRLAKDTSSRSNAIRNKSAASMPTLTHRGKALETIYKMEKEAVANMAKKDELPETEDGDDDAQRQGA